MLTQSCKCGCCTVLPASSLTKLGIYPMRCFGGKGLLPPYQYAPENNYVKPSTMIARIFKRLHT